MYFPSNAFALILFTFLSLAPPVRFPCTSAHLFPNPLLPQPWPLIQTYHSVVVFTSPPKMHLQGRIGGNRYPTVTHLPLAPNNLFKKHDSTETNSVLLGYFGLQTMALLLFYPSLSGSDVGPLLQYIILYCMYKVVSNVSSVFRHSWHSFDTPSLVSLLVPLQTVLVRTPMDVALGWASKS